MKRKEFLKRLEEGLDRLPPEELKDVLDYYNEIFLDAGKENEEQTAAGFGNIEDIIRQIYAENGIDPDGRPQYAMDSVIIPEDRPQDRYGQGHFYSRQNNAPRSSGGSGTLAKWLLAILLFPIWLPILAVVFSLLFALAIIIIALEFALGVTAAALVAGGFVAILSVPPLGFVMTGAGLILVGIFTIISVPVFKSAWRGLRDLANAVANKAHSLFFSRR